MTAPTEEAFIVYPADPNQTVGFMAAKSWAIQLLCSAPACKRTVTWPVADYTARFADDVTLAAIAARAVCSCGSRRGVVRNLHDHGATMRENMARIAAEQQAKADQVAHGDPQP